MRYRVPQVTQWPPVGRDSELAFFGAVVAEYATWLILRPMSGPSSTMYYRTLKAMLREFASAYRDGILAAFELVTEQQASYFSERPHTFVSSDWFAPFYFDEYENETQHPEMLYFADFQEFDGDLANLIRS